MSSGWNPLDWLAQYLATKLYNDLPSTRFFLTICYVENRLVWRTFIFFSLARYYYFGIMASSFIVRLYSLGSGIIHLLIGILSTLATLHIFGPTDLAVALTFVFNMTYLLVGYYCMNYGTYDINWTMSYCILCLRLIGLAWDYRDSSLPVERLSEYQKSAAFKELPSLLEMLSFCFMPTACFAGPQFTWRHYHSFIDQTLRPQIILKNRTLMQKYLLNPKLHRTLSRLSVGIACLALYVLSLTYYPMDYMLTHEFLTERSFFYRVSYMCIYSNFLIMRYLAIWLIGEGACVFLGLGCTGRIRVDYYDSFKNTNDSKKEVQGGVTTGPLLDGVGPSRFRKVAVLSSSSSGGFRRIEEFDDLEAIEAAVREGRATVTEAQHTRCANISVVRFESATNTDLLVSSFNINTNKWMLEYLYKRLRFLGNKSISQALTLTFLAIWHGFYSGYYVNFFLEFITIYAEKQFLAIVHRSIYADFLYETLAGKIITTIAGKLHILFTLSSPLVAFSMLRASLWIPVFNSVYWIGFIYLLWPLAAPLAKKVFPPKPRVEIVKSDS
ncbi:Lysophospholipid acyltransferase 5 [Taenia crassiceps]|uniref:Lysophospholipid acyltransferase 5 n=1 Tax=Taenia crassiceps TaxID=6207 RepID=A0ABR4Q1C3_9CEST